MRLFLLITISMLSAAAGAKPSKAPARLDFLSFVDREVGNPKKLPRDVQDWFRSVMKHDFARAVTTWPAVRAHVSDSLLTTAEATQLYVLYKNDLAQTFVDQWLTQLADARFEQSKAAAALEAEVSPAFENWLALNPILLNPKDRKLLSRLPDSKHFALVLKALDAAHDVAKARVLLPKLGPSNWQSQTLANTLVYDSARKKDLRGASTTIKNYIEPGIAVNHDLERLAAKDLMVARILYQAGKMDAAREFYLRIPNTSKSYLQAREELAWVYLRLGDTSHLRGEVVTLTSPVFEDRFSPESYVVRAVSNLKLCFYDKLEKDFSDFKRVNTDWAKKITSALAAPKPPMPADADESIVWTRRVRERLETEAKLIRTAQGMRDTNRAGSGKAYWAAIDTNLQQDLAEAKKHEALELHRLWNNRRKELAEAIKKMRFVKTEYMSEMMELAQRSKAVPPDGALLAANETSIKLEKGEKNEELFPVEGDLWPDELFRIRSTAQMNCLKNGGH